MYSFYDTNINRDLFSGMASFNRIIAKKGEYIYMNLRIMTWNIKGESSLVWNNQYVIRKEAVDKIIEQKADVIVLTAFVVAQGIDNLYDKFEKSGFVWFQYSRTGKNGILIAIKRDIINVRKLITQVYQSNIISSEIENCNILKIRFPLKSGENFCVLGCRLETGGEEELKKQYDSQRNSFYEVLMPYIRKINSDDYCIICGDFNNARCLGDLNKKYDSRNYNGKAQINYNLNIIKDEFDSLGFVMADCNNGAPIPTHKKYIPDDHIFIKGFCVTKCEPVSVGELSDHDILIADVVFGINKAYVYD